MNLTTVLRRRVERWDQERRFSFFHELRRRLYRSRDGKVLGVFRGIAESMGFCVFWTRAIGCVVLLTLTDFFGAHGLVVTLLVGGFFYLLAALLMQPPRPIDAATPAAGQSGAGFSGWRSSARPAYPPAPRERVNLATLDQQLDRLNQRIQRMEAVVTDRQYDWERRMEG